MATNPETRCIFCWSSDNLTREHVFSGPVRRLIGAKDDADITWDQDGSAQLWAGPTTAERITDLTVTAVCRECNNHWMGQLDGRFARSVRWWAQHPNARLGKDLFHVVRRYLTKLLWVVRVGEDWSTNEWLKGIRREPEFITLSIIQDAQIIRDPRTIDEQPAMQTFVGAARVADSATSLLYIPPITADGILPTQKIRRINAGIVLTLRAIELRLWCVLSPLDERWNARWPPGVTAMSPHTRFSRLSTVAADQNDGPHLSYRGTGPVPDVAAFFDELMTEVIARLSDREE